MLNRVGSSLAVACVLLSCGGSDGAGGSPLDPATEDPGVDASGTLPVSIATSQDRFTSWLLLDVDGDGDLDLVGGRSVATATPAAEDVVLLNDGFARFTELPGALPPRFFGTKSETIELTSADLNGDAVPDLVALVVDGNDATFSMSGQLHLFFGNGDGTFRDATAAVENGHLSGSGSAGPGGSGWWKWVRLADFDGDGAIDLLGIPVAPDLRGPTLWRNAGASFTVEREFWVPPMEGLTNGGWPWETALAGDADGDGDVDIVTLTSGHFPESDLGGFPQLLHRNVSTPGTLAFETEAFGANYRAPDGVFLDIDGDGFPDFVTRTDLGGTVVPPAPLAAYRNDGTGLFAEATSELLGGTRLLAFHPRDWEVADFNGDGRLDIFVADHGHDGEPFPGARNFLLLSDGGGALSDRTMTAFPAAAASGFTHSVTSGDVDGDGDVDLFLGDEFVPPQGGAKIHPALYLNDGAGRFTKKN